MNRCAKWYNSTRYCASPVAWMVKAPRERNLTPQPACPAHLAVVISQTFSVGGVTSVQVTKAEGPPAERQEQL